MLATNPFHDLMNRVRAGDGEAAAELVRDYETTLRVAVRARLTNPALRRYFDSLDVCQSVFKSFFRHAAVGRLDARDANEFVRLLVGMTRKKLARYIRRYRRRQRDYRRLLDDSGHLIGAQPDPHPPPDQRATERDLIDGVYSRLSAEERHLAEAWAGGETWDSIAGRLGGSAEARRKQLHRALQRVLEDFGRDAGRADEQ